MKLKSTSLEIVTTLALIPLSLLVYSACTVLAIYRAARAVWK